MGELKTSVEQNGNSVEISVEQDYINCGLWTKRTEEGVEYQTFVFEGISSDERKKREKELRERAIELMYIHSEFYKYVDEKDYVTRGAKLVCSLSDKTILLDASIDSGSYYSTHAILTCNDCKNGENICNFGACGKKGHEPLYSDLVPHPIDVVKNMDGEERYKCFPLLPKEWSKAESHKVYAKNEDGTFSEVLLKEDYMVCLYGGTITIEETVDIEEPEEEQKQEEGTMERYVVLTDCVHIRSSASTEGEIIENFNATKRINVIKDSVKKDKTGRKWCEVDLGNGERGWVADEFILPDKDIVTKFDAQKILEVNIDYKDGRKSKKKSFQNWYTNSDRKASSKHEGRYSVAVGPKIFNYKYPDDGLVNADDFNAFDRDIKLTIREKGTDHTIPLLCYVCDFKAHTYNKYPETKFSKPKGKRKPHNKNANEIVTVNVESGFYQTGIRYPYSNNTDFKEENIDGSIVEFYPNYKQVEKDKNINLAQFELLEIEVKLKNESK